LYLIKSADKIIKNSNTSPKAAYMKENPEGNQIARSGGNGGKIMILVNFSGSTVLKLY
jgi:hypothetical protein